MKYFPKVTAGALALLILVMGPPLVGHAQAPTWQMVTATSQASGFPPAVQAMTTDTDGNVYVAGYFHNTISFGNTTLISDRGSQDIFVAKWSKATNSYVWAQRAGGPSVDLAESIAVSGTSVYVAGTFYSSTATFGDVTLAEVDGGDMFVAKLTDLGTNSVFVWAQGGGGIGVDGARDIAVSGPNVYVTGTFSSSSASFGAITLVKTNPDNAVATDLFVAKLTDAGNSARFAWAQRAGGTGSDVSRAIAVSGPHIYITGFFDSAVINFGSSILTNSGGDDGFVVKLIDAGTNSDFSWAHQASGLNDERVAEVAVNGENIYVTGYFASTTASFDDKLLTNTNANMTADVFVVKLTDSGSSASVIWAQRAEGMSNEYGTAIVVNEADVYVTGVYASATAAFGSSSLTLMGGNDVFVAKLADAGGTSNFVWAQGAGGPGNDQAFAIAANKVSVYVGGSIAPPASFGPLVVSNPVNTRVAFIASLTDATLTPTRAARLGPSISFFPNPARTITTVSIPALPAAAAATFTLLDALGRPVRTHTAALPAAGLRHELSLAGLPAGVYALRVNAGTTSTTRRLVVE